MAQRGSCWLRSSACRLAGTEAVLAVEALIGGGGGRAGLRVQPRGLVNPGNLCFMNATLQVWGGLARWVLPVWKRGQCPRSAIFTCTVMMCLVWSCSEALAP